MRHAEIGEIPGDIRRVVERELLLELHAVGRVRWMGAGGAVHFGIESHGGGHRKINARGLSTPVHNSAETRA